MNNFTNNSKKERRSMDVKIIILTFIAGFAVGYAWRWFVVSYLYTLGDDENED